MSNSVSFNLYLAYYLITELPFSVSVFIFLFLIPFLFFSKVKIKSWASKQLMHEHNQIKNINESFSMFKYIKTIIMKIFLINMYNNFFTAYYKN